MPTGSGGVWVRKICLQEARGKPRMTGPKEFSAAQRTLVKNKFLFRKQRKKDCLGPEGGRERFAPRLPKKREDKETRHTEGLNYSSRPGKKGYEILGSPS